MGLALDILRELNPKPVSTIKLASAAERPPMLKRLGFGSYSRMTLSEMLDAGYSLPSIEDVVRREILIMALQRTKGNRIKAAALLGVHRNTLFRAIKSVQNAKPCDNRLHDAVSDLRRTQTPSGVR